MCHLDHDLGSYIGLMRYRNFVDPITFSGPVVIMARIRGIQTMYGIRKPVVYGKVEQNRHAYYLSPLKLNNENQTTLRHNF